MGMCAEACAEKYNFSRDDQDAYCIESYTRAQVMGVSKPSTRRHPIKPYLKSSPCTVSQHKS